MATPQRNLILEQVATELGKISTANGFKTDVTTVERHIVDWASVGSDQFPWLGFSPGTTRVDRNPGQRARCTMTIDFVGHINAATDADRSDQINDLMDDVWEALNQATLNGGSSSVATHTVVTEFQTDEGDPDTMDSRGGSGTFHLVAESTYHRTRGAT